jgi:homogentisate 1,2-dioxygenase
MQLRYQSGFGNEFATEAVENALPARGNTPQNPPLGLYAEQLSGTPFIVPRHANLRTWLYRIRPSALHGAFSLYTHPLWLTSPFGKSPVAPNRLRWDPPPAPKKAVDIIDGLFTMAAGGAEGGGLGVHMYAAIASMHGRYFYNADGEMLFVPQHGGLTFRTEMGVLDIAPGEIAVIPRGVKFAVDLKDASARGYVCENYGAPFVLPDLGPIGSNGLAAPRHFLYPVAAFEDKEGEYELLAKFDGALWRTTFGHSPLDVVAWHGNYAPYKYDLANFMVVNTVSFDHADPSIFTVLAAPDADFVIFPPRWSVAEDTFRPPYFHRNIMSEFMGLVKGAYDAKGEGFAPGGASLHNRMTAHGPDAESFAHASGASLEPVYLADTLAFMFETRHLLRPTHHALNNGLQGDYDACWAGLRKNFIP